MYSGHPCFLRLLRSACWSLLALSGGGVNAQTSDPASTHFPSGANNAAGSPGALLDDPIFREEAARQREQNVTVTQRVTQGMIEETKKSLPVLNQIGGALKYGTHNTISPNGEGIVAQIRSLATATNTERHGILQKLQEQSRQGIPEAITFMGFAFEYGLFGARKDVLRARQYYDVAAKAHYQPAIYNLAIVAAYGKGEDRNVKLAAELIDQAAAKGPESSLRVCGFGAFIHYRRGDLRRALSFTTACPSPLTALPLAASGNGGTQEQLIERLRKSIATGLDDGYPLLEQVTREHEATDMQFNHCKYALVDRYRAKTRFDPLRDDAIRCYGQTVANTDDRSTDDNRRDQVVAGIVSFVPTEIASLQGMRKSNHFHYGWSVPYLPFPQKEVDLFEPLIEPSVDSRLEPQHQPLDVAGK